MSPEEILEWAEKVEIAQGEGWLDEITRVLRDVPLDDYFTPNMTPPLYIDCNCPMYGICMNTACPRAIRITNNLNGIEV